MNVTYWLTESLLLVSQGHMDEDVQAALLQIIRMRQEFVCWTFLRQNTMLPTDTSSFSQSPLLWPLWVLSVCVCVFVSQQNCLSEVLKFHFVEVWLFPDILLCVVGTGK